MLSSNSMHVCPECGLSVPEAGFCPTDGTALADRADDVLLGESVGQYRIARLIGVGGMGRVYKAVQPRINSRVAVKVLSHDCAGNAELVERFFAEARAVNLIRHENIINVLDLASLPDGRPYIIMEFLDGAPLTNVIADHGTLPLGSLARIAGEVLGALSAAHGAAIVHRDLKPDNIFITPQGRAKVLDFGIAKLMPELTGGAGPTRTGSLLGTPHYMAPEQANAQAVDARTDIYAMGVMLYEGATGERPFKNAQSLYDLLRQVIESTPTPPRAIRPDIPAAFEAVIDKAMHKSPDERFQSADEMALALADAVRGMPEAAWAPVGPAGERSDARIGPPSVPTPGYVGVASTVSSKQITPPPAAARTRKTWMVGASVAVLVAAGVLVALLATSSQSSKSNSEKVAQAPSAPGDKSARATPIGSALAAPKLTPAAPASEFVPTAPAEAAPAGSAAPVKAAPAAPVKTAPAAPVKTAPAAPVKTAPTAPVKTTPAPTKAPTPAPATRRSGGFNPKSFNISRFLSSAERRAKARISDAVLIRLDATGVYPSGNADLTLDKSFSVTYRFASPSGAKRPAKLPMGVPYKSTCLIYVTVDEGGVSTRVLKGWKCKPPWIGRPKCSVKQIWKRAIRKGAPRSNAVADIGYWARMGGSDGRWHFAIKGVKSFWVEDDC